MRTSQLVVFYLSEGSDSTGRMIDEILSWNDKQLEDVHDYIQWLFPLQERSGFNSSAPLVTADDVAIFHENSMAREKLLLSFARLLDFYGFSVVMDSNVIKIVKSEKFGEKSHNWLTPYNHNFLRITRILKSLVLLGHGKYAILFLQTLEEVYKDNSQIIGEKTLCYWKNAICS